MIWGNVRIAAAAIALAFGQALAVEVPDARPTRSPTPTTFALLKGRVDDFIVDEKARDRQLVIGIQVTDTHEGFTYELSDGRIQVREGLPPRAAAVLSGRRSSIEKLVEGSETLSGAVRRNLVDVQGNLDKVFELIDCCIRRRPTPTPTAPNR